VRLVRVPQVVPVLLLLLLLLLLLPSALFLRLAGSSA
jgi:hypothetical protein